MHEPIVREAREDFIHAADRGEVALRLQNQQPYLGHIEPQVQQRLIDLTKNAQRPVIGSRFADSGNTFGLRSFRPADEQGRGAALVIQREGGVTVADPPFNTIGLQRRQRNPGLLRFSLFRRPLTRPLDYKLFKPAARRKSIHQAPFHGALSLDPIGERAENVSQVAPHLPLIFKTSQTAGSRKHP